MSDKSIIYAWKRANPLATSEDLLRFMFTLPDTRAALVRQSRARK